MQASDTAAAHNSGKKPAPGDEFRKIKAQWADAQLLAEEEARQAAAHAASSTPHRKQGAASETELIDEMKKADVQKNKAKENEFKTQHLGILGLFGWLL